MSSKVDKNDQTLGEDMSSKVDKNDQTLGEDMSSELDSGEDMSPVLDSGKDMSPLITEPEISNAENLERSVITGDTIDLYAVPVGVNGDHPKDDMFIIATNDSNLYQVYFEPWAKLGALSLCTNSKECTTLLNDLQSQTSPCTVSRSTNFSTSDDSSGACKIATNMAIELHLARQNYIENNFSWEEYSNSANGENNHMSHGFLEIDWDPGDLFWGDEVSCDTGSCAIASLICDASVSMDQEASNYACPIAFDCC